MQDGDLEIDAVQQKGEKRKFDEIEKLVEVGHQKSKLDHDTADNDIDKLLTETDDGRVCFHFFYIFFINEVAFILLKTRRNVLIDNRICCKLSRK